MFMLVCLSNSLNLDMENGFQSVMDKCYERDKDRFEKKGYLFFCRACLVGVCEDFEDLLTDNRSQITNYFACLPASMLQVFAK